MRIPWLYHLQAVYEGNLVHRAPGDASTLSLIEQQFPSSADWVASELQHRPQPAESSSQHVADSQHNTQAQTQGHSFTRVVIADLKPEVLQQISDSARYETVCRDLAHLYHYYLHGEHGNRLASQVNEAATQKQGSRKRKSHSPGDPPPEKVQKPATLPSGQKLPEIIIEHTVEGQPSWFAHLVDVDDDPESLYLRAQQAQMLFTLTVPDHGVVSGVLWYFPYQGDAETIPLLDHPMLFNAGQANHATQLTQAGAAQPTQMTQLPAGTQAPFAGANRLMCVCMSITRCLRCSMMCHFCEVNIAR